MDSFVYCVGTIVIIGFVIFGVWWIWLQIGRNYIYKQLGLRQAGQVYCDAFRTVTNIMRQISGQAIIPTSTLIITAQVILQLDRAEAHAVASETPATGTCIKTILTALEAAQE